jgi:hypothetical protein
LLLGTWIEGAPLHDVVRTSFFLADAAGGAAPSTRARDRQGGQIRHPVGQPIVASAQHDDRQGRQGHGTDQDDSRCSDDRHREPPTRRHVFIAKPECRAP